MDDTPFLRFQVPKEIMTIAFSNNFKFTIPSINFHQFRYSIQWSYGRKVSNQRHLFKTYKIIRQPRITKSMGLLYPRAQRPSDVHVSTVLRIVSQLGYYSTVTSTDEESLESCVRRLARRLAKSIIMHKVRGVVKKK